MSSVLAGKGAGFPEPLFEDHAGQLWVGRVGLNPTLSIYKNGRLRPINRNDGSPIGVIAGITEDVDKNIWVETFHKSVRSLLRIRDYKVQEEFFAQQVPTARRVVADPGGGIWLGLLNGDLARLRNGQAETFHFERSRDSDVEQMMITRDGAVMGATAFGLIGWKNGKKQILTVRNGLPCDSVHALVADASDNLWLYMQCGLVEIANAEVQRWWKQSNAIVQFRFFDRFDGVIPGRASFRGADRSPDGRLWFVNGSVLQMIDPAHLAGNVFPPPVHVEEIVADRKSYAPQEGLRIPPLTRDLEIDYTALSFAIPQKVRFRYQLEGRDVQWAEPGTRRQAFYTDLHPGKYRFRVIACNNDGIWNEEGATLNFSVAPAWYQTNWFLALCVISGFFVVWALYRLRVGQIARVMSARFDERTRMARELHDTFLQTVQGSKLVADYALAQSDDPVLMRRAVGELSVWLRQADQEGRATLNSLRTSNTQTNDLAEALRRAIEECRTQSSLEGSLSVVGDAKEMHQAVRDELYRIGYEAIRNACTHSRGSRLEVGLSYGQDLALHVKDNGIGIEPAVAENGKEGHFGLRGMRERAARIGGKLSVASSAQSGTEIAVVVPGRIVFRKRIATRLEKFRATFRRMDRTSDPD